MDPRAALAVVVGLSFWIGFLGLYAFGRRAGSSQATSLLAAGIFTLAPYHLVDWYSRTAVAELYAFALLPWVAAGTWALVEGPGSLGLVLASGLAWCLLMLSHPLFHMLGVPAMGLLGLGLAWQARSAKGLLWAAAAYLLGLALAAWFVAPGLLLGPQMAIKDTFQVLDIIPLKVLFSLRSIPGAGCPDPSLGLELGVLLWAGWLAWALLARRQVTGLLLALAGLALLLAWGPLGIWAHLGLLNSVHSAFRMLLPVCLFGALPAAEGWMALLGRRWPLLLLFLLVASLQVLDHGLPKAGEAPAPSGFKPMESGLLVFDQDGFQLGDCKSWWDSRLGCRALNRKGRLMVESCDTTASAGDISLGKDVRFSIHGAQAGSHLLLPLFFYPGYYRIMVNGQRAPYGRNGCRLALQLPAGDSYVEVSFMGLAWANWVSMLAWLAFAAGLALWALRRRKGAQTP
jgi:hypothetical protein